MLEKLKQNFHRHDPVDRNLHGHLNQRLDCAINNNTSNHDVQPCETQFNKTQPHETLQQEATTQLQLGHYCFEQGQFDAAIIHYRHALSTDPTRTEIYPYLAETLSKVGKLSEAAACYRQAIVLATPPESGTMRSSTDMLCHQQPETGNAMQLSSECTDCSSECTNCSSVELGVKQTATETDSSHDRGNNGKSSNGKSNNEKNNNGKFSSRKSRNKKSGNGFANLKTNGTSNGNSSIASQELVPDLTQAENYYQQQKWQETVTYCRQVIQIQPNVSAYKLLGNALQRLGEFSEAAESYMSAMQLEPQSADLYANLGSLYAQQQRWQDAVIYYQNAIALKPDFAGVYRNLAKVWIQLGQSHQAADCWYRAFGLEPEAVSVEDRINLGNLLLGQNQIEAAIDCYRSAIQLEPTLAGGYQNLAAALVRQGKPQEAELFYRKAQELGLNVASFALSGDSAAPNRANKSIAPTNGKQPHSETMSASLSTNDNGSQRHPIVNDAETNQTESRRLNNAQTQVTQTQVAATANYFEQDQWNLVTDAEVLEQLEPELVQTYRQMTEAFHEKDKLVEVIRSSTEALKQLEPELVQTCRELAESFHAKGKLAEAIRCYQRIVQLEPNSAADRVNLGSLYAQQEQWQAAIDCYQGAITLDANLASAHWNLAKVWEEIHQPEQAAEAFSRALMLEPSWASPSEHLALGRALRSQGNEAIAIAWYQSLIERDVTCAEAYAALGEIFATQQQWQDSITHYRQAILYRRDNLKDLIHLAQVFVCAQQWRKAIAVYRQVIGRDPQPAHYLALAQCLEQQEHWDEAIECYQTLTVHYSDWQVYHKLGDLLNQQQRWQEAVIAFRQAIELNPNHSWSHNNLGDALIHLEQWQAAANTFQKAIELNPGFHWSHYNLGDALAKLEQWDGAIEAYRRAIKLQPDMPYVHQKLGDVLHERSKLDQATAIQLYRRAISRSPEDLTSYHRAIEMQPHNRSLYLELADALVRQGESGGARVFYQIAQQLQQNADSTYVLPENDGALKNNSQDNCLDSFTPSFNEIETASFNTDVRLIAFYLPQFHPIPENDQWWGKGFTEWTNVSKAKPLFEGHYQPHLPSDLGFYDLRLAEVREEQARLAKEYGIYGFCYYYYWFSGKRLLDQPLNEMLMSGKPDFPFCICWANENWTRRWDGAEHEVLMVQEHSLENDKMFAESLVPYFRDSRYIRINGKPLIVIYRANLIPDISNAISRWREVWHTHGIGEVHLCGALTFGLTEREITRMGFESSVQFPPHGVTAGEISSETLGVKGYTGKIYDMRDVVSNSLSTPLPEEKSFYSVMTAWDNTARKGNAGNIFLHSSPELYEMWLRGIIEKTQQKHTGDEKLVFINAWNEWAEGTHLEPDRKHGHAFLLATSRALLGTHSLSSALGLMRYIPVQDKESLQRLVGELEQRVEATERSFNEAIRLVEKLENLKVKVVEVKSNYEHESGYSYVEYPIAGSQFADNVLAIKGWLIDRFSSPVKVELISEGNQVSSGIVNVARPDILKKHKGFGTEYSGFELKYEMKGSVNTELKVVVTLTNGKVINVGFLRFEVEKEATKQSINLKKKVKWDSKHKDDLLKLFQLLRQSCRAQERSEIVDELEIILANRIEAISVMNEVLRLEGNSLF